MRYHLILVGLLMFFGGVAYTLHGDRGAGLAPLVPGFVFLGGLSVVVGAATCDVVAAIRGHGKGGRHDPA